KNSLAASVRFGARNHNNYQDGLFTESYINDAFNRSTMYDVKTKDLSNTIDLNLTYTRLYDKPQKELNILALYSKNNRDNDSDSRLLEALGNVQDERSFLNRYDSYNQEVGLQLDYQTPIGENQIVEFGGKDIMRKVYSDFTRFEDFGGPEYEPVSGERYSNNLNYDQNVLSGYLAYTLNLSNGISVKAGSRYEYTTI